MLILMLINFGVGKYAKRRTMRDLGMAVYSEALVEQCLDAGWIAYTPDDIGLSMYCLTEKGLEEIKREHISA